MKAFLLNFHFRNLLFFQWFFKGNQATLLTVGSLILLLLLVLNSIFSFIFFDNFFGSLDFIKFLLFCVLFPIHIYISMNALIFDYIYDYTIKLVNYFFTIFLVLKLVNLIYIFLFI